MGQWMAANLHKAGYTVYGFDTSQESLKNAKIQVSSFSHQIFLGDGS
jgi:3-hydroxyisobutyrate dehydrogenase-like beta-hydroxyacid dehydrogenase